MYGRGILVDLDVHDANEYGYKRCPGGQGNSGRERWADWLNQMTEDYDDEDRDDLGSRDAYHGGGYLDGSEWGADEYAAVQRLYHAFVDFQVDIQKEMIRTLAAKIADVTLPASHPGLKFFIFSPLQGPDTVDAHSELTLNLSGVTNSNVVREFSTWDLARDTEAQRNAWAAQAGSNDYYFVLQQAWERVTGENSPENRRDRAFASIRHLLNPAGSNDPWNDSFAFWTRWREDDKSGVTLADQREYMNKVKEALT